MTRAPLLDTHAWIWWINGDRQLPPDVSAALDELPAEGRPLLSDISLWEVAMLVTLDRLRLTVPLDQWLQRAADPRAVRVLPITPAVALEVTRLPKGFRRDPADRVIVATARAHNCPVITRDRAILRSGLVTTWTPAAPPSGRTSSRG